MSLSLDSQYLSEISIYLPLFKWQRGGQVAACRCIICGDSKKDQTKTRGFFYPDEDRTYLRYKCHNCGASMKFSFFLKSNFNETYRDYCLEKFKDRHKKKPVEKVEEQKPIEVPQETKDKPRNKPHWIYVSYLEDNHPAKQYCISRGLSEKHMRRIVYSDCFQKWAYDNIGELELSPPKGPRLIFPFIDENGECYGAQGRIFIETDKSSRFTSAMKKDSKKGKVFGLERVNKTLPVIVVEGVIDSILLPNCIAICGGDMNKEFKNISENVIVALDNEPRSKDTINRTEKAIDMGFRVVIWPLDSKLKDINDMIKSGMTVRDILKIIAENSFSGLKAKAKLTFWKKI